VRLQRTMQRLRADQMRQAFVKIWKSRLVDESKALEKTNEKYDEV
jgi:hypothetical protein